MHIYELTKTVRPSKMQLKYRISFSFQAISVQQTFRAIYYLLFGSRAFRVSQHQKYMKFSIPLLIRRA